MSSKWSIPALMAAKGAITTAIDPDAQAFITATGISGTNATAINVLVIAAKANGWWTLCNAIYPMIGGTSTTCKYNLKNPLDTDGAFRLTFSAGWTFSSTGVLPNGTSAFADTHLAPSSVLAQFDTHMSFYSRTSFDDPGTFNGDMGGNGSGTFYTIIRTSGSIYGSTNNGAQPANFINGTSLGLFLVSRLTNISITAYANNSSLGTNTGVEVGALTPFNVYLGALNNSGTAGNFSNRECAFATIGAGISSGIASLMYSDIITYQISLARNV